MDINSFVTGFSMGKKKGGSAILTELTVTENGVYDNPMIGGGLEPITWDGVIGDKVSVDLSGGNGEAVFIKVSDRVLTAIDCIGGEICVHIAGSNHLAPINDSNVAEYYGATGVMASSDDGSPCIMSIADPEQVYENMGFEFPETGTYFFNVGNSMYVQSLTFAGDAPTPADGWNKVTVNVAGDIVDVAESPTESIDETKIYRVTNGDAVTYCIPNNATVQRLVDGAWVELT